MEPIIRAMIMYFFLLFVVRISGKRTMSDVTIFDFVLILIIGDASQQGITGKDYSVVNTLLIISTLILLDVLLAFIKTKYKKLEKIIDGLPLIIVHNGECITKNLKATRVSTEDILEYARKTQGIERLEQIKYAVLEKDGAISIIPYKSER